MSTHGTIVVAGALSLRPARGGHTWVYLQYLLGFRRLGWEGLFIDRLDEGQWADVDGARCEPENSTNIQYVDSVMRSFGLGERFAVLCGGSAATIGISRKDLLETVRQAPFVLNVMGYLNDEELLAA